jgi:predicted CXXCH cytochrome family protein
VTKHPPIDDGDCATCHKPHASDNSFLLTAATQFDVCGACHDWQKHSGHPIGAKAIDPRNKSLTLDCGSCHRTHGTDFKHFTHKDAKAELCVQCHQTFTR